MNSPDAHEWTKKQVKDMRERYGDNDQAWADGFNATTHGLRLRIKGLEGQRDGNWLDKDGCCKVCDGEIPHGHTDNCDIWKLEQQLARMDAAMHEMLHLPNKLRDEARLLIDQLAAEREKLQGWLTKYCYKDLDDVADELRKRDEQLADERVKWQLGIMQLNKQHGDQLAAAVEALKRLQRFAFPREQQEIITAALAKIEEGQ